MIKDHETDERKMWKRIRESYHNGNLKVNDKSHSRDTVRTMKEGGMSQGGNCVVMGGNYTLGGKYPVVYSEVEL